MIGGVCKIFIKSRSFVADLTVTNWHLTHRKAFNWIFVIFSVWQSGNYKYGETPVFWYCRLVHQSSNTLFFCLSLSLFLTESCAIYGDVWHVDFSLLFVFIAWILHFCCNCCDHTNETEVESLCAFDAKARQFWQINLVKWIIGLNLLCKQVNWCPKNYHTTHTK